MIDINLDLVGPMKKPVSSVPDVALGLKVVGLVTSLKEEVRCTKPRRGVG